MDDRSAADRSRTMAAIRSADTTPEREFRSQLHARGVRYRLGQVIEVGDRSIRPDLVFKRARVAVFIDGCYWHGCPEHCRMPSSNVDYWEAKIERNRRRDRATDALLTDAGWTVVRFWEHEPPQSSAALVEQILERR